MTSPAREGLPPCMIHYARLGELVAFVHDYTICNLPTYYTRPERFGISLGKPHDGSKYWAGHPFGAVEIKTDFTNDLDEARAAFERGAKWVRTGEGP